MLRSLFALALLAPADGQQQTSVATGAGSAASADPAIDSSLAPGTMRIDRGEGRLPLWAPPAEELTFDVRIDLGFVGSIGVGKVNLSSLIEDYRPGLPLPGVGGAAGGGSGAGQRAARLRSYAKGGHLGYDLEHELVTRVLPQAWPWILYQDTQTGTENRRRELKIGQRGAGVGSEYRHDGHCQGCDRREHFVSSALPWGAPHHCKGCKRGQHRVWRESKPRALPAGTVDMLSAVYLARGFLREGREQASFTLIDKERLWDVTLTTGERMNIDTKLGSFDCTQVRLNTARPASEPDNGKFSGLFGIQGELRLWMHTQSGVPVLIQGDLPVGGIMTLGVDVRIEGHEGTPPAFQPAGKR